MYQYTCLNAISQVGLSRFTADYTMTDDKNKADAILVRSANMHEMELPKQVLAIARAGAGVNNIPLDACAKKGVVVFNTPGANANGVKELVFAGMLLASRDIVGGVNWAAAQAGNESIAKDTEKEKKKFAGSELSGKKLGIIGLGAIGVLVANAATHLGIEVYGYDPYISVDAAWNLSRSIKHISDVNEIYRECDFITIHVPLMDSTKGMINKEAVDQMKSNAVILNFARDLLVDEDAILEALDQGKIKKYVSDFPNTKTVGHKGTIVIPHLGASTEESEDNCAVMAVNELQDFLENGNIRNSVNYPNCSMGVCETAGRVAIYHKNVKMMISQFTTILSDTNIVNMSNTSRGEYAYTLLDLEDTVCPDTVRKLESIEGVMRVRIVK
ncbi:MAG: 3-phosphoglycerate dehydrogenase family protein [Lachnospiraceae bacterium]|nr:3-phosphoglycerate dehydrogenase family protein [Lachnospiraceae bacterium]